MSLTCDLPAVSVSRPNSSSNQPEITSSRNIKEIGNYQDDDVHVTGTGREFWDVVEVFLNKPPPSLKDHKQPAENDILPKLKRERSKLRKSNGLVNPHENIFQSKINIRNQEQSSRTIDPKLLAEAFAYSESIEKSCNMEKLANIITTDLQTGEKCKKVKSKKSKTTKIKKQSQKSSKKVHINPSSSLGFEAENKSGGNNRLDPQTLESLRNNFENGTTLAILQKQLLQSKASLENSRNAIQIAAKEFFKAK